MLKMSAPIQNLDEWLKTATEKLSLPAKDRIKLEIGSHFADAVATHSAEGLSEDEAQSRALSELGDAKAAARRFRRSHLTEDEARSLESKWKIFGDSRPGPWVIGFTLAMRLFLTSLIFQMLQKYHILRFWPGVSAVIYLTLPILFLVACRTGAPFRPRLLLTLEIANIVNMFMFVLFIADKLNWGSTISPLGLLACFMILNVGTIRLWLKVLRIRDVGQEPPPPGPTAA
jgi:hypothetical protein